MCQGQVIGGVQPYGYPQNPPDTAGSLIERLRARRAQVDHDTKAAHVAVRELAAEAVVLDRLIAAAESPA